MADYNADTDVPVENKAAILKEGNRRAKYAADLGDWRDQLDYIYHNGLAAWKVKVKAVKDAYP